MIIKLSGADIAEIQINPLEEIPDAADLVRDDQARHHLRAHSETRYERHGTKATLKL
jgi:hypothetical protein